MKHQNKAAGTKTTETTEKTGTAGTTGNIKVKGIHSLSNRTSSSGSSFFHNFYLHVSPPPEDKPKIM